MQLLDDLLVYGVAITKQGKRVSPWDFYLLPIDDPHDPIGKEWMNKL